MKIVALRKIVIKNIRQIYLILLHEDLDLCKFHLYQKQIIDF